MINFDLIKEQFNNVVFTDNKLIADDNVYDVLSFLKTKYEYAYDMLTSIMAVDYIDFIELIYKLYSTSRNDFLDVSVNVQKSTVSVTKLYKSAYFDECEIYDMFGVEFIGNENLKRLYMPQDWIGNPLLKSYNQSDERLVWNE